MHNVPKNQKPARPVTLDDIPIRWGHSVTGARPDVKIPAPEDGPMLKARMDAWGIADQIQDRIKITGELIELAADQNPDLPEMVRFKGGLEQVLSQLTRTLKTETDPAQIATRAEEAENVVKYLVHGRF